MAELSLESQSVNINKIISSKVGTGNPLSVSELQVLIAGGVMHELDAQIEMFKSGMEASNEKKSILRNDINDLNTLIGTEGTTSVTFKNSATPSESISNTAITVSEKTYNILKSACEKYGIWDDVSKLAGKGSGKYYYTKDALNSLKGAMDNELVDLNAGTETDTIKFQALMDARKQNLMMLSNMINSDNQMKMSIINNMKS